MEAHPRYTALAPNLTILTGFEGEKLEDIGVSLTDCTYVLHRLHLNAIPNRALAEHHYCCVLDALLHRRTVGSVLANRIYPPTTPQELEALTHG